MEELTRLEERIMQCIWDYQGEVPFLDLIETVKEKLNKSKLPRKEEKHMCSH